MKDTILHIRFNSEIKKQLEKQAERENTNLSNLVDRILRNYLQKERGNEMNKNEIKKLKTITEIIESEFDNNNGRRTNNGYVIDDVDYVYGSYILDNSNIKTDVDGDTILRDILYNYVNDGTPEYYKVIDEDIITQ